MIVNVDKERLMAYIEGSEDAEALGGGEYALDLYDADPPVALDIMIGRNKIEVLAALELLFDEESGGYYPGERIYDAARVEALIRGAISDEEGA